MRGEDETIGPVLIQCGKCSFIASEVEFSPNGDTHEDLMCPKCSDVDSLFDFDEEKGEVEHA